LVPHGPIIAVGSEPPIISGALVRHTSHQRVGGHAGPQ
jgi:hypothetical protein